MKVVGVVGLGQIGGSLAKALIREKITVAGFDTDYATRRAAEASGIPLAAGPAEILATSSIVFCCVSIAANRESVASLLHISEAVSKYPTISDVASYKAGVLPEVWPPQLIPGHPMAGSHGFGFGSASASLFEGAVWNLVVDVNVASERLVELIEVITLLRAGVHLCSQAWHDETVSLVSGLPHAVALGLGSLACGPIGGRARLTLAAGSFKGATRVLLSEPRFFSDLLRYNRPTLLPLLRSLREEVESLENILSIDDRGTLDGMLAKARDEIEALFGERWNISRTEIPALRKS